MNDFVIFGVQAVSSVSAGALILGSGWNQLNYFAIPAVIVAGIATVALLLHRRRTGTAAKA